MARSFLVSLSIHLAVLALALFGLRFDSRVPTREEEPAVVIRPLLIDEPGLPEFPRGSLHPSERPAEKPMPEPPAADVQQKPEPVPPAADVAPTTSEPRPVPRLVLPEPDYPTRPVNERAMPSQSEVSGSGPSGRSGEDRGEDRPAIPYYHPAVTIPGTSGKPWILVRFDIESNGKFEVEILEGTGDIHQDARALHVLRRWKWLPMRIDGEEIATVEVVRLFRNDVR